MVKASSACCQSRHEASGICQLPVAPPAAFIALMATLLASPSSSAFRQRRKSIGFSSFRAVTAHFAFVLANADALCNAQCFVGTWVFQVQAKAATVFDCGIASEIAGRLPGVQSFQDESTREAYRSRSPRSHRSRARAPGEVANVAPSGAFARPPGYLPSGACCHRQACRGTPPGCSERRAQTHGTGRHTQTPARVPVRLDSNEARSLDNPGCRFAGGRIPALLRTLESCLDSSVGTLQALSGVAR